MRTPALPLVACTLILVSACAVGPDFTSPQLPTKVQWNSAQTDSAGDSQPAAPVDVRWWTRFNDATLDDLVQRALDSNLDVRIAALRVAQSRMQRQGLAGKQWPSLNASASYQGERLSEFGTSTRLVDAIAPANRQALIDILSEPHQVYQAGFDASWELDLWGRVRRTLESADASVAASTEELHAARLSLIAEVARNYLEFIGAQRQRRIVEQDIRTGEELLKLTEERAAGGTVTQLDVASQRALLSSTRATLPPLQQTAIAALNSLALLLGEEPGALHDLAARSPSVPSVPVDVAMGVPSEAARRRPDIRRAEARLHAATADIGVAIADLYPRITLTGSFVAQSLHASDLTDWGARQWVVGPTLYLPIFNHGQQRSVVELRKLQQQQAAVEYQRTVLQAWHEIETALSACQAERQRNRQLAAGVAASKDAFELATLRYRHGLTSFIVALDAQRNLLQAERALSNSSTTLATQLVALQKALGGGWQQDPAASLEHDM